MHAVVFSALLIKMLMVHFKTYFDYLSVVYGVSKIRIKNEKLIHFPSMNAKTMSFKMSYKGIMGSLNPPPPS